MSSRIIRNAAQCVNCGHILESTHRHDYRTHECTDGRFREYHFMVDGGKDYIRRGYGGSGPGFVNKPEANYIELSEYHDETPVSASGV